MPKDATFGEKSCSGRSLQGPLSRIGGANRCLLVVIDSNRLMITPQFPFNLMFLPEFYGLERDVPVESITSITPTTKLLRKVLKIEFAPGLGAPFELAIHDENGFLKAIGRGDI